jgi:hypothetical protein
VNDTHADLPLFRWTPPQCVVLPFPIAFRIGAARKVAEQLSRAKTNREADHVLTRAHGTMRGQFERAGLSYHEKDRDAFARMIRAECDRRRSKWVPTLPEDGPQHRQPDGAA